MKIVNLAFKIQNGMALGKCVLCVGKITTFYPQESSNNIEIRLSRINKI